MRGGDVDDAPRLFAIIPGSASQVVWNADDGLIAK